MGASLYLFFSRFAQLVNCPVDDAGCQGNSNTNLPEVTASTTQIRTVLQFVFGIVGAIAVLMIVISGLKLITSQGDPQGITSAKQSILYAVIGLVVALSAELIVTYVLTSA